MRRFVAIFLALSLLSSGISGCSQPIDTGSSVPAQSQPIVALLALFGVGVALTALHHHRESHPGGGGGGPTIFGANFSVAPFIGGYKPVDLVVDQFNSSLGAIELLTTGGGTGKFTEIQSFGGGTSFGTYTLPSGYAPSAVAMDSAGVTWFVDATGKGQGCSAMTTLSTTCTSVATFNDGLGAGSRSIAADQNIVFVILDAGSGKVKWYANLQSGVATGTGTYTPGTTSPIFAADAVESTTTSPSGFTVYHQDGSSEFITFSVSGSILTLNPPQANFGFNPIPLKALSNFQTETSKVAFYSFTGNPAASYFLTKYETPGAFGLSKPTATSALIELNGQVGNPGGGSFTSPLSSLHYDAAEFSLWALDQNGNIVNFSTF